MITKTFANVTAILLLGSLIGCGGSGSQTATNTPSTPSTPVSPYGVEQTYQTPQWQGDYAVATTTYHFQDTSRGEPHTADTSDDRELLVRLFYPTDVTTSNNKLPLLPVDFWQREGTIETISGKALRPSNFNFVHWDVMVDSPISDAQLTYPLIIFSNGYGFTPEMHVHIAADLASRGFIVASINHPYGSGITRFADGRVIHSMSLPSDNLGADLQLWSDDQLFVIDQLKDHSVISDNLLFGRLDERIGTMGHSYGGAAAYYSAWQDSRVLAAINLDGSIFNREGKNLEQPFMYMQNDNGYSHDVFDQVNNDGYAVVFHHQINHHSFSDYPLFWAWDFPDKFPFGNMHSQQALTLIDDLAEQFFDKYFDQAPAPLLDEASERTADIEIIKFE